MTGLKDKVQHLKVLYRDRNLAADGKVLLTHENVYKVTPDFRDNELMARGVRIQAQSVDSQDDELPFTYFRPIRDRLYFLGVRRHQGCAGSDVSRTRRLRFISDRPQ